MNIEKLREEINSYLESYFKDKNDYNKVIYQAMNYSLNIGGKKIRPILLLLTYRMYKSTIEEAIPFAASIEMIHTYSLIHDDLPAMDNDDLRRGKPTNHKVFGDALAILSGDGLLNEAINLMIKSSLKSENLKIALEATYEITTSSGTEGMIGGQVVDIINERKQIKDDELKYMHLKKTGELIKASIIAGAILGGAPKEEIEILRKFGYNLGLAFQIKDDILDVTSTTEVLGKDANSDIENSKCNFISIYGLDYCEKECKRITDDCLNLLKNLNRDSNALKELTLLLLNRQK